jgi:hypothetical protein
MQSQKKNIPSILVRILIVFLKLYFFMKTRLFFFLCSYVTTSAFSQINLQSDLIACYSFEGNANDGTGNNNHGTVNGATLTTDRFGNQNNAYQFNGSNSYISIPTSQLLNNNYTYSIWIKLSSLPEPSVSAVAWSIGDNTSRHQTINVSNFYSSGGATGICSGGYNLISSPATTGLQSNVLPSINQWYHVVSTRTDTEMRLFINGSLIAASSTSNSLPYYGSPPYAILGMRCNLTQPFNGAIDDVTLYNRALTVQEVQKLFSDGVPCSSIMPPKADNKKRCGEGSLELLATGAANYRWYDAEVNGDLLFEGNPYITPVLTSKRDFYVCAVSQNRESQRIKVTAIVHPQPELECNFSEEYFEDTDNSYSANVRSGTPPLSFVYDFGNNVNKQTANSTISHQFNEAGQYTVTVLVTDAAGCEASCSDVVKILKKEIFIPNIITPNSDQKNDNFKVYHQVEKHYRELDPGQSFFMQIFNRWGKEVFNTHNPLAGWAATDDSAGIYYYTVALDNNIFKGSIHVKK